MLAGALVGTVPKYRRLIGHQIDDVEALHELGDRVSSYATIPVPTVLVRGSRTPGFNDGRFSTLVDIVPDAREIVLEGQGHAAHLRAPDRLAGVIGELVDAVLR